MTDSAPSPKTCPTCGQTVPPDAPGGACPRCLLGAGIPTGRRNVEPPSAAEVAAWFPDYEILGLLGRGGMGVVWKARNRAMDRIVALKVLPRDVAAGTGFGERFQREARALARLSHPNIVGVHEFGQRDGVFFVVLEYVDGVNLRHALREGRIGPRDALRIVPQICDALQYAHEHGVVHRDIKPENVLLDAEGRVKVADFGIAKIVVGDAPAADLTATGQVMGTPHYMAPEQWEKPTTVDHRADIYSLGVVFYEMLTGELPLGRFQAPSHKVQVDVRFDEVVLRSLEKEPERRWQHAAEVKSEVGTIADTPAPAAGPACALPRTSRLAIYGASAVPSAVLCVLVGIVLANGFDLAFPVSRMLVAVGAVVGLGWIASVVSWILIERSGGRLGGRAWAITGTVLPLVAGCVAAPVAYLVSVRSSQENARRQTADLAQQMGQAVEASRGSPEDARINRLCRDAVQRLLDEVRGKPRAALAFYGDDDRAFLARRLNERSLKVEARGELGLPLLLATWNPAQPTEIEECSTTPRESDETGTSVDLHLRLTMWRGDTGFPHTVSAAAVVSGDHVAFRELPCVVTPEATTSSRAASGRHGFGTTRSPAPTPDALSPAPADAPPAVRIESMQASVDALWRALVQFRSKSGANPLAALAPDAGLYSPATLDELRAYHADVAAAMGRNGDLGLPLTPDETLGGSLASFRVVEVKVNGGNRTARVTVKSGPRTVTFGLTCRGVERWYFDTDPIVVDPPAVARGEGEIAGIELNGVDADHAKAIAGLWHACVKAARGGDFADALGLYPPEQRSALRALASADLDALARQGRGSDLGAPLWAIGMGRASLDGFRLTDLVGIEPQVLPDGRVFTVAAIARNGESVLQFRLVGISPAGKSPPRTDWYFERGEVTPRGGR